MKWTTTRRKAGTDDYEGGAFHNRILEWSGHPYARALLDSSRKDTECLVEGGDPMNGPYMMICPEILGISDVWDRLLMHSVQGKDVQLRLIWETLATYEAARTRLETGGVVRLKAVAAGTGLSMILAYDRLIKEGQDPARITVRITDRDKANVDKTRTVAGQTGFHPEPGHECGSRGRDLHRHGRPFCRTVGRIRRDGRDKYHVVTAVGILDYLQGFTCSTTERRRSVCSTRRIR